MGIKVEEHESKEGRCKDGGGGTDNRDLNEYLQCADALCAIAARARARPATFIMIEILKREGR